MFVIVRTRSVGIEGQTHYLSEINIEFYNNEFICNHHAFSTCKGLFFEKSSDATKVMDILKDILDTDYCYAIKEIKLV